MRSRLVNRALAGLALALLPALAQAQSATPYLDHEPVIASWLPAQPQPGDVTDTRDVAVFFASRPLAIDGAPRWTLAKADDVLAAGDVADRFSETLGVKLTAQNSGKLIGVMSRVLADDGAMLVQLKHDVRDGGRVRPYVRFVGQPGCPFAYDDARYNLRDTGSYPSGHATYGWMWGLVLSAIVPEKADAIMIRAYDFGQSRLICGFHYPSDLDAGRLAASELYIRLSADPAFAHDLVQARQELRKALNLPLK